MMPEQQPLEVVVTTKNTASLTLGIIATVVGVVALLVGWVPFFGLIALPGAVLGLLFAVTGIIIALVRGMKGIGMPIIGGLICGIALAVPIVSTGGTSVAIQSVREQVAEELVRSEKEDEAVESVYVSEYLKLYDVEARYMESVLHGRVPGILFKIRNNGDKSLDRVEVTVYFKDADGTIIAEEEYTPVFVSEYSFSRDDKPLKPGYIWQNERGKFYSAKSIPTEWDEGSIDIRITDLRFTETE